MHRGRMFFTVFVLMAGLQTPAIFAQGFMLSAIAI
jgi:hypothetical protein